MTRLYQDIFRAKKSLKIPKGLSESAYRRRTDNTMDKRKIRKDKQRSTKLTYKTKDRVTQITLKGRKGKHFLLH